LLRPEFDRRASVDNGSGGMSWIVASRWTTMAALGFVAIVAGGCSNFRWTAPAPPGDSEQRTDAGQVATLRAIGGSAISGKVRVVDRGDGATVLVSATNFPSGAYRLAFHERPNCSSPNGFSAGSAWAPASFTKPAAELVPPQYANSEARVEAELRVAGLRASGANGVAGRSVVLYAGTEIPRIEPGVPNAAIACGVFESARSSMF
jgi:Cu/Zn superoxide dismutase